MPIACTLDAQSMPARLEEWNGLLARATTRTQTSEGRLRLEFDRDVAIDDLARLVAAEQQCCAFFSFAIVVDGRGLALEVDAADDAAELVIALLGAPA